MSRSDTPERTSDRIHDALRAEILQGRRSPGERMPSERNLAAELNVGRPAVREALKRLQQAGLIVISQGGATEVLDWRETAGLELLPEVAVGGSIPHQEIARAMVEMRATIGVDAAARCAVRASETDRVEIAKLAAEAAAAVDDPVALDEKHALTWRAIVVGSGNIAYLLAFTSLMRTLDSYPDVVEAVRPTDPELIKGLGREIAAGEPAASALAAAELLTPNESLTNW